jgi:hypothetical protein
MADDATRGAETDDTPDRATRHGTRDVEGQHGPFPGRLDVAEREVERLVERVDDRCDRAPLLLASDAAAGLVGHQRGEHCDRVQPGAPDLLRVGDAADHFVSCVVAGLERRIGRHPSEVAHERAHAHRRDEGAPYHVRTEVLGLECLPRKSFGGDQLGGLLRRLGGERGAMGAQDPRDAVCEFAVCLADGPTDREIGRAAALRLRLGEAEQVAVRPAIALLVLDELERERVRILVEVPTGDRATQTAAPAAELFDVAGEQEQLRAGAAHLRHGGECACAGLRIIRRRAGGEREHDRMLLRVAAGHRHAHDLVDRARPVESDAAQHRLRVLLHELSLGRVVARPSTPSIRKRRRRLQSSTAHAKPPALFGTCADAGIASLCGVARVENQLSGFLRAMCAPIEVIETDGVVGRVVTPGATADSAEATVRGLPSAWHGWRMNGPLRPDRPSVVLWCCGRVVGPEYGRSRRVLDH